MKFGMRLLGLLTHNFGWKLLSLAIAVVVWGVVANEPELSTFATVEVQYKNLPDDLEISSDPVSSVKLELRGPSGELRGVRDGGTSPEVILDMSKVEPGEHTFPIGDGSVQLVRGVSLVRAIPSEVRFRFEYSKERTVKVAPRFRAPEGYEVSEYTVVPDAVQIAGPASHVERVEAVLTDQVILPTREGTFDYVVNTFVEDPFVRFPEVSRVAVSVTVRKREIPGTVAHRGQ